MNIQEQIKTLEATIAERQSSLVAIQTKAADEGRTKDAQEQEQFDTASRELEAAQKEIGDLRKLEAMSIAKATPVQGATQKQAEASRAQVVVRNTQKLAPGIGMARIARVEGLAFKMRRAPEDIVKSVYPDDEKLVNLFIQKAAVPAASTLVSGWAGFLVDDSSGPAADFVEYLRPQTIVGRFGMNGIPSLRTVPARTRLLSQTSGGAGYWVGEGKAKPLTQFAGSETSLAPLKVANIAVATMELLRDSSPSADMWIRDQLVAALRERLDIDFIDPAKAAVANVSPASILNGVTGIPSSGSTADDIRADVQALFGQFIAANNAPTSGVWIMSATNALALGMMLNPLGQPEFPGVSMTGGTFFGLPVIVSEYVPSDTAGSIVALVNASDIYLVDEGGFDVSASDQASLQMDDAPTQSSIATVTATSMVSMWQTNSVAFRAERAINWARRRTQSVSYLTGVAWGG